MKIPTSLASVAKFACALASLVLCHTVSATTVNTVIDFDSAPVGAFTNLVVGDFQFTYIGFGDLQAVRDIGGGDHVLVDSNPGNAFGAEVIMSRVGGGAFTVTQFDLLNLNGGSPFWTPFHVNGSNSGPGTYFVNLPGLDLNIVSSLFGQNGFDGGVDNIHVTYEVNDVPETSATFGLLSLGLFGLCALRRKLARA